jgi:hypothetical protein
MTDSTVFMVFNGMSYGLLRVDQSRPCAPYSSRAGWGDNGHPTVEWVRLQAVRRLLREVRVA